MAARDVLGRDGILYMKVSGNWFPVLCAKVNQFDLAQEEIETTNINSGPNREYVPGMADSTVGLTGITRVNNADGRVNIVYLIQQSIRRQVHELQLRLIAQNSDASIMTFNAFVTSTNITNEKTLMSNSSVTFRVTGGLSFDTVIPEPTEPVCEVQAPLYLDTVESESSVSDALLETAGVVILEVQREGVQHDETEGTPGNREFKFTGGAGNGIIAFDTNVPFNPGEVIYVLYKIPV